MAAQVFAILVTIVIAGFLWFYIVRPILEDYGIIKEGEGVKPSQVVMSRAPSPPPPDQRPEPEPARSASEPHGTTFDGSENQRELVLNADEIEAVNRMIKHNTTAAKPSKSSTIQAGFGVSRGGSAAYVRASLIYDTLFGQPEPAVMTPIAGRRTRAKFIDSKAS
jgi:hypothetical protein